LSEALQEWKKHRPSKFAIRTSQKVSITINIPCLAWIDLAASKSSVDTAISPCSENSSCTGGLGFTFPRYLQSRLWAPPKWSSLKSAASSSTCLFDKQHAAPTLSSLRSSISLSGQPSQICKEKCPYCHVYRRRTTCNASSSTSPSLEISPLKRLTIRTSKF